MPTGQALVKVIEVESKREAQMSEQEKHVRELVKATLKTYEGLESAREALGKLHPDPDLTYIQEPDCGDEGVLLLDEALGWVACMTDFREQKDNEDGVQWLEAYLKEVK